MVDHVSVIEEAVSWLYDNPDARPSAAEVAARYGYSPDHFGRVFRAVAGEALGDFLARRPLERAASRLMKCPSMSVTDIAVEAGYSSSNFAVAFKRRYGLAPSAYRRDPAGAVPDRYRAALERIAFLRAGGARGAAASGATGADYPSGAADPLEDACSVRVIETMHLFRERFRGPYPALGPAWRSFCLRAQARFPGLETRFVGISQDDPMVSDPERSVYDLCCTVPAPGRGPSYLTIPRRAYAVNAYDAALSELIHGFNDLVAVWMPRHGLQPADGPVLELYRPVPRPEGFIACDICVPVDVL